jgi:TetR/AcrR family transcriptional repressor of nem operon
MDHVMRYPDGHKAEVRARIVEAASHAIRRDGLDGVSIPALMKQVGLTHGGFYAHFRDRDELVAAAVGVAADETAERVFGGDLAASLDAYLSAAHLAHPDVGCVVAALGAEAPRQKAPVRKAFARAARGLIQRVEARLHPRSRSLHRDSLALTAQLVGAVVLARLVQDPALAQQILESVRKP